MERCQETIQVSSLNVSSLILQLLSAHQLPRRLRRRNQRSPLLQATSLELQGACCLMYKVCLDFHKPKHPLVAYRHSHVGNICIIWCWTDLPNHRTQWLSTSHSALQLQSDLVLIWVPSEADHKTRRWGLAVYLEGEENISKEVKQGSTGYVMYRKGTLSNQLHLG